jgi:hypothetical protein
MVSYETIMIVPSLHRNVISFFGMPPRSEVICFRKLHDRIIILDDKNTLKTWSITTGKLLC